MRVKDPYFFGVITVFITIIINISQKRHSGNVETYIIYVIHVDMFSIHKQNKKDVICYEVDPF